MCAYNVRRKKSLDVIPATGWRRTADFLREVLTWTVGLGAMYAVYWLARRFLFG